MNFYFCPKIVESNVLAWFAMSSAPQPPESVWYFIANSVISTLSPENLKDMESFLPPLIMPVVGKNLAFQTIVRMPVSGLFFCSKPITAPKL